MKIKTFKIKVESDEQSFDFSDFFDWSEKINQITPTLVKEKNSYYWYVFVTFQNNYYFFTPKRELNKDFEKEVYAIINNEELNLSTRFKNVIKYSMDDIQDYEKIGDFRRMRNFGTLGFNQNQDTLFQILEIAKKYKEKKEDE